MMTGAGPFGSVEMGGMFTVVKVRREQKPGDYGDPGWYRHPPGTIAYEWGAAAAEPPRSGAAGGQSMPLHTAAAHDVEVRVRKPGQRAGHAGH
jgi:hypothetical protein